MTITLSPLITARFISLCITLWIISKLYNAVRRYVRTTRLNGPPRVNLIFGVSGLLNKTSDPGDVFEEWVKLYGSVYQVPAPLGAKRIMLCDPKAIAHLYARDSWTYTHSPLSKIFLENAIGRGVLWADGESHKRQRKAMSPGFSNTAIKHLVPAILHCDHKLRTAWDTILESSPDGEAFIDISDWMNRLTLDGVGLAGFSYDFHALDGVTSPVAAVFEALGSLVPSVVDIFVFLLASVLPSLLGKFPTRRTQLVRKFRRSVAEISDDVLLRAKEGKIAGDKSVVGILIREDTDSNLHMTSEQIQAQIALMILAGYETTSITLTWALVELSRNPDIQAKLRDELSVLGSNEPSWEQLTNGLPYLDAVTHEAFRRHPSVVETERIAIQDDVIPLSQSLRTASGQIVNQISVAAGTIISVSIACMNTSIEMWGSRAKDFVPERWLSAEGLNAGRAKEIQGHRHLLNFTDGPRMCLGRGFAVAEVKAALCLLVRNYTFELPDGPGTVIDFQRGILARPKVKGETGSRVPLRIRRVR